MQRVQIETANICNLQCTVCDSGRERCGSLLPIDYIHQIINHKMGSSSTIQFGYRSEFTSDPRCIEISNMCRPLPVVIWTNGINIERFIQSGGYVSEIVISILGGVTSPYSYEDITSHKLDEIIGIIKRVSDQHLVSICITTYTQRQSEELISIFNSFNIKNIMVNEMGILGESVAHHLKRSFIYKNPRVSYLPTTLHDYQTRCPMLPWDECINYKGDIELCCLHSPIIITNRQDSYTSTFEKFQESVVGFPNNICYSSKCSYSLWRTYTNGNTNSRI